MRGARRARRRALPRFASWKKPTFHSAQSCLYVTPDNGASSFAHVLIVLARLRKGCSLETGGWAHPWITPTVTLVLRLTLGEGGGQRGEVGCFLGPPFPEGSDTLRFAEPSGGHAGAVSPCLPCREESPRSDKLCRTLQYSYCSLAAAARRDWVYRGHMAIVSPLQHL